MHLLFTGPVGPLQRMVLLALLAFLHVTSYAQDPSHRGQHTQRFLQGRRPTIANVATQIAQARIQHGLLAAAPRATTLSTPWTAVGPLQVLTPTYGLVTGRVTALALDPADSTGNTLYAGTSGGGLWKSTNAAGPAANVTFTPLTDTLPVFSANASSSATASLSIGAIAIANGILLAGTGDPNDASDSYFGSGILRSPDGGTTWTLIQGSQDGTAGNHSFFGLAIAGLAFSSTNPQLAVAAVSEAAEGTLVNAPYANGSTMGLYYSPDAGQTWHLASIYDGSQAVEAVQQPTSNAVTSVVWNPVRQRFYAAVRFHGYYESSDGRTWNRLANQPSPTLAQASCPTATGSTACPIFRGTLAVQPVTGDLFALSTDLANKDQGLYRDICNLTGSACANATVLFGTKLVSTALDTSQTNTIIPQADYNLTLAATPSGASDTALYVGTIDLYKCTLAGGCTLRNTTNAVNGCSNPAGVAPSHHALALRSSFVFTGTDGGLYRSTDAINQVASPCNVDDATHFQNLNTGLGSLAEVISFAQHPTDPLVFLAGLGSLGTAGTSSPPNVWPQLATGEGGSVAIDPTTPDNRYLSAAAGINIARCTKGSACIAADFNKTITATQTANDTSAIDAPWLLDPQQPANLLVGTCRVWRGPASSGSLWSSSNLLSRPFAAPTATSCSSTYPVIRSLATGGPTSTSASAQSAGSQVLYAGLTGSTTSSFGGHLFTTSAANLASGSTVWTDLATSPVTNNSAGSTAFNPGQFDISSIAVDPHDPTGHTVYATIMGFAGNNLNTQHLYRSTDAGAHWLNISSNLPNAPANSVVVDPNDANTLYIALDTGVYVTAQVTACAAANCWSVYGAGLPNAPVLQLSAAANMPTGDGHTGLLRAATYGRGIWQIPLLTAFGPATPSISVAPTTLTFASQQVATRSATQALIVTNSGTASLTISSILPPADFTETDTCTASAIPPQSTCSVQVAFVPTAAGTRSGTLTLYGNVPGGQATVTLSGTGTPAATIVLTPVSLTLATTALGATSAAQNITISNTGGTTSALQTPVVSGDFALKANTCTATLAPQTSCTVSIAFTPTAPGTRTGALTIVDDAGTQTAALTGTGTAPPTDTLSPLSLTFPPTQITTTSPTQFLTLLNSGDTALTLIAAQISSGDFTVTNNCGNSLSPHSSCTLAVAYTPHALGMAPGTLTLTDQLRTQTVSLSGTGLAAPGVSLAPSLPIAFSPTPVATTSNAQSVTLTNNGGVSLANISITLVGDFALSANTCPATLAPASSCTVQVIFAPTTSGTRNGLLSVSSNAPNSPQALALSGAGVDFTFNLSGPASQTIASGQTATYPFLLTSPAGVPGSVLFLCSGAPAHTLCAINPPNPALGATTNVTVTLATGLSTASIVPPALPWTKNNLPHPAWLATLLPMFFLLRKRRRLASALLFLLIPLTVTSCASSRTVPNTSSPTSPSGATTPSGTYTVVVTATSAGLPRSTNLTLIVQ